MALLKITKRHVDAAPIPEKGDAYFWDTDLRGFGLRVTPRGVRSYVVQYRLPGRPARRVTIGIHGSPWTPEKARDRAEHILMDAKRGDDPVHAAKKRARAAVDLEFSRYIDTFTNGYLKHEWKDSWADARRRLEIHVLPLLKGRPLEVLADMAAGPGPVGGNLPTMAERSGLLRRAKRRWTGGFLFLLMSAASLTAGAVAIGLPLAIVAELAGYDADHAIRWLLALSPIWAPLFAGYTAEHLERMSVWGVPFAKTPARESD